MSSSCCICGEEEAPQHCASLDCTSRICVECLERYLHLCAREQSLPRCLAEKCSALFLRSHCPVPQVYDHALFHALLRDPQLAEHSRKEEFRQQLVREREKFLEDSFPESIRRAVHILYASELRQVHKSNVDATMEKSTKRCFRTFCKGYMKLQSGKWKCGRCESVFCEQCELQHKGSEHQCRAEEVASVQWKTQLPQCPRCGQAIEKSDGCNFITCAVCQQHFSYTTGEVSTAGNHGKSIPVTLSEAGTHRLWALLLRGRSPDELIRTREKTLVNELQSLESYSLEGDTEWKSFDLPMLLHWDAETQEEKKVAHQVALRVEKLEKRKQERQHVLRRLRRLEEAILSL